MRQGQHLWSFTAPINRALVYMTCGWSKTDQPSRRLCLPALGLQNAIASVSTSHQKTLAFNHSLQSLWARLNSPCPVQPYSPVLTKLCRKRHAEDAPWEGTSHLRFRFLISKSSLGLFLSVSVEPNATFFLIKPRAHTSRLSLNSLNGKIEL